MPMFIVVSLLAAFFPSPPVPAPPVLGDLQAGHRPAQGGLGPGDVHPLLATAQSGLRPPASGLCSGHVNLLRPFRRVGHHDDLVGPDLHEPII